MVQPIESVRYGARDEWDFDSVYRGVLRRIMVDGRPVAGGESQSVGSHRMTREILNFGLELSSARDRMLFNQARRWNPITAVGRFVWMMGGSARLADIQFYEPRVAEFSDDGITIPGSSYGARLRYSSPGLDQVANAITTLKRDTSSRRAAAAIYLPSDSGRESRDIPCAFGVMYNVRDGLLMATTIMRSNNAYTLLPYNVFEFTLLAEYVAAEVGVDLGSYHHFATSMHVYADDVDKVDAVTTAVPNSRWVMPPMPSGPRDSVNALLRYETELRLGHLGLSKSWPQFASRASGLGPYWSQFAYVLLFHCLRLTQQRGPAEQVAALLEPSLAELVRPHYPDLFAQH